MNEYLWLIISAIFVFVMQAGFLCLESGRIRSKNSINVAAKNLADFVLAFIVFWIFGFGFMFGDSFTGFIGTDFFFVSGNLPAWDISFFLFQVMFCGTATTLMSGAVAERMTFNGYLIAALILNACIYPVVGHWAWASAFREGNLGWLEGLGFVDFAGAMVVHGVGGWMALIAVMIIGPRIGRFGHGGRLSQGNNLPLSTLGTLLIWLGWFGFNGGSTLIFNTTVPMVLLNTCLGAAWGGLIATLIGYVIHKYVDVTHLINGVLAGLVAVTASCHAINSYEAALIGSVAGVLVYWGTQWIEKLEIDDAVGVVPVHLFAGIWGVMSVGIFGDPELLGTGLTHWQQIGVQGLGVVCISLWCVGIGWVALSLLNRFYPLRVSQQQEEQGMNVSEHRATTEVFDLLSSMHHQKNEGDFSTTVPVDPFTEVGQIARQYNQVIERVNTEISYRDEAITNFRSSEQRKTAILDSSMDSIITVNQRGDILEFNPAAERTFGCLKHHIQGKSFITSFVMERDREIVSNSLNHGFMASQGLLLNRRNTLTLLRSSGTEFPSEIAITGTQLGSHLVREFTLNIRDITRQRKLQDKLKNLAYSDPLTGLYNRTFLMERLASSINDIQRSDETLALYFLDLDKFKKINDTMGHRAGDELLCEVAARLTRVTREEDVIARWGGDEFVVLLTGVLNQEIVLTKAEDIINVMRQPVNIAGQVLNIPTSIGIAMTSTAQIDADKLIQYADIAMYQAKLNGRDNYQIFVEDMAKQANKSFEYEQDLKEALLSEQFYLVYQPKVDVNERIVGLEALARWHHQKHGLISPDEFIPIAEESNLIIDLGKRVVVLTLQQMSAWKIEGVPVPPISVNISGKQLLSRDFVSFIQTQLTAFSIEGRLLEIEITEGVLVSDIDRCIEVMSRLKELGIRISVDDFGTGYSSLSYLKRLPIDVLKIDRMFVEECDSVSEDGKICETIINLAKSLTLDTVAEGIETQLQKEFLLSKGCHLFQGYLFYKPLTAGSVKSLIEDFSIDHSYT